MLTALLLTTDAGGGGRAGPEAGGAVRAPVETSGGTVNGFQGALVVRASKAGIPLNSNLTTGGGTDATAAIQAKLDQATASAPLHLVIDGPALVSTIYPSSNTLIECTGGGGFYMKDGTNRATLRNKHPTVGAVADRNITIRGCTFNGNGVNQTGAGLYSTQEPDGTLIGLIQLYGADDIRVERVTLKNAKTIALHISNARNVELHDIDFDNGVAGQFQQGGIQIEGNSSRINMSGIRGYTKDDLIALSSDGARWVNAPHVGLGPYVVAGPITEVTGTNIVGRGAWCAVRLFNHSSLIDRVRFSNISGEFDGMIFSNDPADPRAGNVGTVVVENVNAKIKSPPWLANYAKVFMIYGKAERLTFRNVKLVVTDARTLVDIAPSANVGLLEFDGLEVTESLAASAGMSFVRVNGYVRQFKGRNIRWRRDGALALAGELMKFTATTGMIGELILEGVETNRVRNLVDLNESGSLLSAQLNGVRQVGSDGGATLVVSRGTVQDLSMSNWYGEGALPAVTSGTGAILRKRGDAFPARQVPTTAKALALSTTTRVYDQFNAADGTLNAGRVPAPRGSRAWAVLAGTSSKQVITQGRLRLDGTGPTTEQVVVVTAHADARVSALASYDNLEGGVGIIFRATDSKNYLIYWVSRTASSIYKIQAGVPTLIVSNTVTHFPGVTYSLSASFVGGVINCTVNGGETLSVPAETFNQTATKHGVQGYYGPAYFEEFSVATP